MVSKKKTLGISSTELNDIKPITENQKEVFASYSKGQRKLRKLFRRVYRADER